MKKGFTLIELLAVIVILALLALIATPIILNVIDDVKVNSFNTQINIIEDAADKYLMGNIEQGTLKIGETKVIKLQDLYDNEIIQKIRNPYTGEYLTFAGKRYRIVSKNNEGNTKIVMDEYVTSTGTDRGSIYTYFDKGEYDKENDVMNICLEQNPYAYCNNRFDITDGEGDYDGDKGHNVGYFLNSYASNSFYTSLGEYQSYLDYGTYYLGKWVTGSDYNLVYENAYTNGYGVQQFKVGMLMYGEMLAGNNHPPNTLTTFLISPYNGDVFTTRISSMGYVNSYYPAFSYFVVSPTLTLKPIVKIVNGDGTLNSPYEITM